MTAAQIHLWDDNPSTLDLLGFDAVLQPVVAAMELPDLDPLTISVQSPWGGGKSTILGLLNMQLKDQKRYVVVRTNPWEYDNHDDVAGAILHWFLGTTDEINAATKAGAYFSVNASMRHAALAALPDDRVLPETDFPARRTGAKRPADVTAVERVISEVWGVDPDEVRMRLWRNLRALASAARVLDRLPDALGDLLLEF